MKDTPLKLKAVLFDVDGTLIDTEKIQSDAFITVLQQFGHGHTELTEHGTVHIPGETTQETWTKLKERHAIASGVAELADLKRQAAMNALSAELRAMEGVIELFDELRASGVKIAVVSSAQRERLELIIQKLGLPDHVDEIVSANDVENIKPAPDPYLSAARKLDVEVGACVVIEDAEVGVISAKAAGMKVVAVPNDYTRQMDFSLADLRANSLKELSVPVLENLL